MAQPSQGSKKPAIDPDSFGEKTLADVSAADFLEYLNTDAFVATHVMRFWPEKKKYELFLEPENQRGVKIKDLFKGVREKKKVEIEKPPGTEEIVDPRVVLRDPAFIRELAREVTAQLKG